MLRDSGSACAGGFGEWLCWGSGCVEGVHVLGESLSQTFFFSECVCWGIGCVLVLGDLVRVYVGRVIGFVLVLGDWVCACVGGLGVCLCWVI